MLNTGLMQILFVSAMSVLSAGIILTAASWRFNRKRLTIRDLLVESEGQIVLLFDDTDLIDATPEARQLLNSADSSQPDWEVLISTLAPRFPKLRVQLSSLAESGKMTIQPEDEGHGWIEAEYWDGLARIRLHDTSPTLSTGMSDIAFGALEDELNTLRSLAEDAPQLIWKQDEDGTITWANRSYLMLADALYPSGVDGVPSWPPAQIYDAIGPAPAHGQPSVRRVSIRVPGSNDEDWFEVTSLRRGTGSIHFAVDANGIVGAERAQRNFVQTLTKTFANLSIGLAIFDRQRRLVMFNPALLELTGLPVTFLSARPQIQAMLDSLREINMLPEPKDYISWRDQMAELEAAATNGTYCENWTLPGGQTYRVTGRPHPDGAIAFLFEDISAEVSLTRRFRSEIELGHSVLDAMDEAVAVFSATGTLMLKNRKYSELWSSEPDSKLTDARLGEELKTWQTSCTPNPIWAEIERQLCEPGQLKNPWQKHARLKDGRTLLCRLRLLPGGATMVGFKQAKAEEILSINDDSFAKAEDIQPVRA